MSDPEKQNLLAELIELEAFSVGFEVKPNGIEIQ